MVWDKIRITKANGEIVEAQAPIIISASRSTDIPAFYSDWFIQRINEGYVRWKNPFNGVPLYVSFQKTRLIIFWSKNPKPFIKYLDVIEQRFKNFYFQFTLNDYDKEQLEPRVPALNARIDTFLELSERIGKEKVIWRFDPLILTDKIGVDDLLKKIDNIGNRLFSHTEKLVISFADINHYKKVQNNLRKSAIKYQEFNERLMIEVAQGLCELNQKWHFQIGTCAEKISLENYNIVHNKCIDDDFIIKNFSSDRLLMEFLGVKFVQGDFFNPNSRYEKLKDKGQRQFCGCITSKDIGEYDTCPHLCEYCYANTSKEIALRNWEKYKQNNNNETIKGD